MSILRKLGEVAISVIEKPVDAICNWANEPLKTRQDNRNMAAEQARIKAEKDSEVAKIHAKEEAVAGRVKEIEWAYAEIEEWRKDKTAERLRLTTEAMISYQEKLTQINVEAINAIGHMQLDLRDKAQQLVYEKTKEYKELQKKAVEEAIEEMIRIESEFSDGSRARDILMTAVDKKLANVFESANDFLAELNRDMGQLNGGISLLAERGQIFIQNHLQNFSLPYEGQGELVEGETIESQRARLTRDDDK